MLRSSLVTARLGATVLDGLVGDQDIPKQTGSTTAQWVAEDGALTETDPTFADVHLSPKTVGSMTSVTRRSLINAVPSIEGILRRDLAAVVARAIDYEALFGNGRQHADGVINQPDVVELSLATPSWAQVLTFPTAISDGRRRSWLARLGDEPTCRREAPPPRVRRALAWLETV